MEELNKLRRIVTKQSRITLLDRLKNVGENIKENIFSVGCSIFTIGALCGTIALGVNYSRIKDINEGYSQAYEQVQNIFGVLDSNSNYWQSVPFNQNVFEPVKKSVDLSLSRQDSEEGCEIKGLVGRVQEVVYNPKLSEDTKRTSIDSLTEVLSTLDDSAEPYLLGATLLGILTAAGGFFGYPFFSEEANFRDYNSDKKRLRKEYFNFLDNVKKSRKDGCLDEENIGYLNKFFEGMNLFGVDPSRARAIVRMLGDNLNAKKSKGLLRVLSEHPCYNSTTIKNLFSSYHSLRRIDRDFPLKSSRLKSRKDLFLDLWAKEEGSDSFKLEQLIIACLDYEKTVPEMLESLISGKRDVFEIQRAQTFLSNSIFSKEISKRLAVGYLTNSSIIRLPQGNLGALEDYAKQRMESLSPEEGLKLVSELEGLNVMMDNSSRNIRDKLYSAWGNGTYSSVLDIALIAVKKNFLLAQKVLQEVDVISQQDPVKREAYKKIYSEGFIPTTYLLQRFFSAKDKEAQLEEWKEIKEQIAHGEFDPSNELKRNLEYTHYYIEASRSGKDTSFESYEAVLGGINNEHL